MNESRRTGNALYNVPNTVFYQAYLPARIYAEQITVLP